MAQSDLGPPVELARRPTRFGDHHNAFGFIRLLFAALVILAHVPEVVDMNPDREILYFITGTTTFGTFAVFGFFIVSGYLITGSLLNSSSASSYLTKRIARIYPGFVVASVICLVIVAPLSGASFKGGPLYTIAASLFHMVLLSHPTAEHPFAGQNWSNSVSGLNAPVWTIQYEFACYLFILLLSLAGILQRRVLIAALSLIFLGIGTFGGNILPEWASTSLLFSGPPTEIFRLSGLFLAGSSFYLFKDKIVFTRMTVAFALPLFCVSLFSPYLFPIGYAIFGSYLIFAAAKAGAGTRIGKINARSDISYGVYLYGWPAQQLLIRYTGSDSLIFLDVFTLLIAMIAGWLSWKLVEEPVLKLVRHRQAIERLAQPKNRVEISS